MNVFIPQPLISYTDERCVTASGSNVDGVLRDLDSQFTGIRFRIVDEQNHIRPHVRIFVDGEQEFNLQRNLSGEEELVIVQALSGG
jgi:hypothetical protein